MSFTQSADIAQSINAEKLGSILVIEDDSRVCQSIVKVLQREGYDVCSANGGAEGIALALDFSPDLIICDIVMPEVDGFGVLQRIRNEEHLQNTPFIFLSGRSDIDELREGMNRGADDYLIKPTTPQAILRSVQMRLKKSHSLQRFNECFSRHIAQTVLSRFPHQLMTPLNAIIGLSELLRGESLSPVACELLDDIQSSTYRLERFFKKYLLFTQLELINKQALPELMDRPVFTVETIQQEALRVASFLGRSNDLVFEWDASSLPVCEIMFDRAIMEVLENAFMFSRPNSEVVLRLWHESGSVWVSVTNTGEGFSKNEIPKIGSAFIRFDRPYAAFTGMGIGLYIVKELIRRNDGHFDVSSEGGKTQVRLAIPICSELL